MKLGCESDGNLTQQNQKLNPGSLTPKVRMLLVTKLVGRPYSISWSSLIMNIIIHSEY